MTWAVSYLADNGYLLPEHRDTFCPYASKHSRRGPCLMAHPQSMPKKARPSDMQYVVGAFRAPWAMPRTSGTVRALRTLGGNSSAHRNTRPAEAGRRQAGGGACTMLTSCHSGCIAHYHMLCSSVKGGIHQADVIFLV